MVSSRTLVALVLLFLSFAGADTVLERCASPERSRRAWALLGSSGDALLAAAPACAAAMEGLAHRACAGASADADACASVVGACAEEYFVFHALTATLEPCAATAARQTVPVCVRLGDLGEDDVCGLLLP